MPSAGQMEFQSKPAWGAGGAAPTLTATPDNTDPPALLDLPPLCQRVWRQRLTGQVDALVGVPGATAHDGYFACAGPGSPSVDTDPVKVFTRLRWGGQFLYATPRPGDARALASKFAAAGFILEQPPTPLREGRFASMPWPLHLLAPATHFFLARKVELIPPGQTSDRFTHVVRLIRNPHDDPANRYVVQKSIPDPQYLIDRFRRKFPDAPEALLVKRARKFTDHIFPTFLTRETAFLLILQEHLASPYNRKVPRVVDVEKDERGFVRRFSMTWLRNGGQPLSQLDFAHQSADLLRVVHDVARVIHLDLRMDNMVITPEGVGFIDFGSASRVGEDLSRNPLLASLFGELMQTSQIQRLLDQMTIKGHVTSQTITQARGRVDRSVDFFYLALVFNSPKSNPDLAPLIEYEEDSDDARKLRELTAAILRPPDPNQPIFRSAKDILHAIERIRLNLPRMW